MKSHTAAWKWTWPLWVSCAPTMVKCFSSAKSCNPLLMQYFHKFMCKLKWLRNHVNESETINSQSRRRCSFHSTFSKHTILKVLDRAEYQGEMRFRFYFGLFDYADELKWYIIKGKNRNATLWYDLRKEMVLLRLAVFLPLGISNKMANFSSNSAWLP